MAIWDWFHDCCRQFAAAGDEERLRMAALHDEGFNCQETDPNRSIAVFTEGRQLAERLGEPWWVLFYDTWRVIATLGYKKDFRNVLDLAVRCALEVRKPQYAGHPWRFAAFNNLVHAYVGIDADGYAAEIEDALAYLEAEIPPGPNDDRYVMLGDKRAFLIERGLLPEAYAVAQTQVALVDSDGGNADWYAVQVHSALCWLCAQSGDWDGVAAHAETTEKLARRRGQCETELAEAQLWQAVLARRAGDEAQAGRAYRTATARMARLRTPPSPDYHDALALYFALAGDLPRALRVRDRELESIVERGRLAYECRVRIKRCRLLAQMGQLQEADLAVARASAGKLRLPERFLAEIGQITPSGP
jgi:hypothetical protein